MYISYGVPVSGNFSQPSRRFKQIEVKTCTPLHVIVLCYRYFDLRRRKNLHPPLYECASAIPCRSQLLMAFCKGL